MWGTRDIHIVFSYTHLIIVPVDDQSTASNACGSCLSGW